MSALKLLAIGLLTALISRALSKRLQTGGPATTIEL